MKGYKLSRLEHEKMRYFVEKNVTLHETRMKIIYIIEKCYFDTTIHHNPI